MKAQLAFVLLLSCVLGVRSVWDDVLKEAKQEWNAAEEKMKLGWSATEEEVKKEWKALAEAFVGKKEAAEESSESKESAENDLEDVWKPYTVIDSSNDGEVDVLNRCSDICMKQSLQQEDNYEATQDVCGQGCQAQARAFQGMEAKYPNTSPVLLLGSAVDKCWEDCSARFSHGSILCIAGCDTMRKMQKKELLNRKDNANKKLKMIEHKEVDPKEVEHKETEHKELPQKKIISEKIKQIQHKADELKEAANEAHQDIAKDEEEEGNSRVWTYVLWRPAVNIQGLDLGSQEDAYQTYGQLVRMVQNMMGDIDIPRDPAQNGRGWRDDRMQLRLPESANTRPAALSSDGGFYSRLTESRGGVKDRVEATMAAPGFRKDLYYILIGLCGFLLLTTAFNSIFSQKSEDRQDEDHYFLSGKAAGAKLPTYEDCIKADRDLLVDINNQDSFTKGPLPTFVVLEPVAGVHSETKQKEVEEEEDTRENVV